MLKIYTLALVACALAFSNLASATTPVDVLKAGQSLLNNVTSSVLSEIGTVVQPTPNGSAVANVNANSNLNPNVNLNVTAGADSQNGTAPGAVTTSTTPGPK